MVPLWVDFLNIFLIEEHLTFNRVIETLDQRDYRRFAAAWVAYESYSLTVLYIDVNIVQHGHVQLRWVPELNLLQIDCTLVSIDHFRGYFFAVIVARLLFFLIH